MYLDNYGTLCGYLARDCEIRKRSDNSKDFLVFTICWNAVYLKEEDCKIEKPNFFDLSYFGSDSVNLANYLKKGTLVRVQYSLNQDKWEDNSGKTKSRVSLNAERVEVITSTKPREREEGMR